MFKKKTKNKNIVNLKKIKSIIPKNLNLDKFKINPVEIIEDTKNKIGKFYVNHKKKKEKEKERLEKKRKLDEKKN